MVARPVILVEVESVSASAVKAVFLSAPDVAPAIDRMPVMSSGIFHGTGEFQIWEWNAKKIGVRLMDYINEIKESKNLSKERRMNGSIIV